MQVGTVVVMGTGGGPPTTATREAELPIVQTPPFAAGGRSLSDAEFRSAPGAVEHAVSAEYAWDAGVAIARFLDGLRQARILARQCRACGRTLVPPRMFCERCFRSTVRWVEVAQTGTVQTFSVCHVSWDMRPIDPPELPAVVAIDGTDGGFLHKLGEVAPEDARIGMAVEAVWKTPEQRTGSILDIAYFRPVAGGGD